MFNQFPPPPENHAVYDNVEKYGTARQATGDNIVRRMRIACWIIKATDTNSEYVLLIAFPRQIYTNAHHSCIYRYVACLCLLPQL